MLRTIPLRGKDGMAKAWAVVDVKDYDLVGNLSWYRSGTGYACREQKVEGRCYRIFLHRMILGLEFGDKRQVDHINLDKLDNRRCNLRVVTNAENKQNKRLYSNNKSGYRGVYWHRKAERWAAGYRVAGKSYHLGLFSSAEEAGRVAAAARAKAMPLSN